MDINLEDILRVTTLAIKHLQDGGENVLTTDHDYFWEVLLTDRYDMNKQPVELGVGQLTDDVLQLRRVLSGEDPVSGFDLVRVASLLRLLGETHSW